MRRPTLRFAAPAVLLFTASFSLAQVGSPTWTAPRVAAMSGGNAAARNAARQELMGVVDRPGFPAAYPASIAPDLLSLLKSANPPTQLNAAVIAEHLAARTVDPALIPVASALLGEKSESLALWGVKTTRPFMAAGNAKLAREVAASVKAHPEFGPIADEAYAALVADNGAPGKGAPVSLSAVLSILESRTPRYLNGGAPPSPAAEAPLPVFLSVTCWSLASDAERKQILSDLGDLACSAARSVGDGNANPAVLQGVRNAATALGVIGTKLNNASLIATAKSLEGINPGNAAQMAGTCQSLKAVVKVALP